MTTKEEMMEDARGAHALFVYPPLRVDADVLDAVGELGSRTVRGC